jgi:quinol-cytochrome oxidoreductase complex cytochrome b subunit/coenzyme F420-reducing hydrogenase delta subunit
MRAPSLTAASPVRDALRWTEAMLDRLFGARANPLRHLGAVAFLLFWIVAASGVYLYALFDTSVAGAYASVERLSRDQWWLGGIVRSLHRYASDAFVLVMLLHLAREWIYGRHRGVRWFTWITGVPLLWLALAAGIVGFWLVWDELAQFSAIATMEWLDWLGVFAEPLARNFLRPDSVDDRFFSLLVFLHIGLPLLLLLGMWLHIKRLAHPDTRPAAALTWGTLAALAVLCTLAPVHSGAPADLAGVPPALAFDWFYLAPNALLYAWSPGGVWFLALAVTLLLITLPWLPRARPQPVARVDAVHCNGCARCVADCPYAAIGMAPRGAALDGATANGKREPPIAVVDPALCASCGICAGACPSSTPFRSAAELNTGIDLPQLPIGQLRSRLKCQIARLKGDVKLVVFGCDHAADVRELQRPDTATVSLLCSGQLPPAFVEYALRQGADGVLVAGCGECDCAFRLGNTWTEQRLRGDREPHLRRTVSASEYRVVWAGRDRGRLQREVERFRAQLAAARPGAPQRDSRYA